jgi:nucleoside-diphosphate-sugar epimerase
MTRFVAVELAKDHWFDQSAARRDLGYRPPVDADTAFARSAAWLRAG